MFFSCGKTRRTRGKERYRVLRDEREKVMRAREIE